MRSNRLRLWIVAAALPVLVSCGGTKEAGMAGLWATLGGVSNVSSLAHAFGSQLESNAAANAALGMAGIASAKSGLYNTIAKTGGYKIDKGSDLLSVLKMQDLDDSAVAGVGASLMAAGQDQNLSSGAMDALTKMWEPIGKSL
jgi:hypothetical protein